MKIEKHNAKLKRTSIKKIIRYPNSTNISTNIEKIKLDTKTATLSRCIQGRIQGPVKCLKLRVFLRQ